MKKTYIQPTLLAVEMQEDQKVMIAYSITDQDGNSGTTIGGSSDDQDIPIGGGAKESHSIWDNEW